MKVALLFFLLSAHGTVFAAAGADALSAEAVRKAIAALEQNYGPELSDDEKARALLQGMLDRLSPSVSLSGTMEGKNAAAPFHSEVVEGRAGYLRPGEFSKENIARMRDTLKDWQSKKIGAAILDLRGTPPDSDFEAALDLAQFFCPKGTQLFNLVPLNGGSPAASTNFKTNTDPLFAGVLVMLVNGETAGAVEAAARALRVSGKAMLVGDPTAGKEFAFSETPLGNGMVLKMAVAKVEFTDGAPAGKLKPDISEGAGADVQKIMEAITAHGVESVVTERGRPHLNEAALVAGNDPDIDSLQAEQQKRPGVAAPIDRQLQRALDLVTSISIFEGKKQGMQ